MYDYACMVRWSAQHDLLINRVGVINEIHGCSHHVGFGNPCRVYWSDGGYVCEYAGVVLCRWRLYDLDSLDSAFSVVDSLADSLWLVRRAGFLRVLTLC